MMHWKTELPIHTQSDERFVMPLETTDALASLRSRLRQAALQDEGVAIAEVLRTRMYDVDYRNPALAVEDYAKLGGSDAAACLTCQHQACLNACPSYPMKFRKR